MAAKDVQFAGTALETFTWRKSSFDVSVSPHGLFKSYKQYSIEGETSSRITVVVDLNHDLVYGKSTALRLVLGNQPLTTSVTRTTKDPWGEWQLEAVVPPPEGQSTVFIPIWVQALDNTDTIIDSIKVGSFAYETQTSSDEELPAYSPRTKRGIPNIKTSVTYAEYKKQQVEYYWNKYLPYPPSPSSPVSPYCPSRRGAFKLRGSSESLRRLLDDYE